MITYIGFSYRAIIKDSIFGTADMVSELSALIDNVSFAMKVITSFIQYGGTLLSQLYVVVIKQKSVISYKLFDSCEGE